MASGDYRLHFEAEWNPNYFQEISSQFRYVFSDSKGGEYCIWEIQNRTNAKSRDGKYNSGTIEVMPVLLVVLRAIGLRT